MDKAEGIKLWEKAAAQSGEVQTIAQYNLRIAYSSGEGVSVAKMKGIEWFKQSAHLGDAMAQHALGIAYSSGEGVSVDNFESSNR